MEIIYKQTSSNGVMALNLIFFTHNLEENLIWFLIIYMKW